MLSHTSTEWAPWHVIPADHKWFARICVSAVLVHALMEIDPRYPELTAEQEREELEAKEALMAEEPPGRRAGVAPGREVNRPRAHPVRRRPPRRPAVPGRAGTGRSR